MRFLSKAVCLGTLASFMGCGFFSGNTGILASDVPEAALLAEAFNQDQRDFRVIALGISGDLTHPRDKEPDMVLGKDLTSSAVKRRMKDLGPILSASGYTAGDFYPGALALGQYQGSQALLPYSFDLNILLSQDADAYGTPPTVDVKDLATKTLEYNNKTLGKRHLGFSTRWNFPWTVNLSGIFTVNFSEDPSGALTWNAQGLKDFQTFISDFVIKDNLGIENDQDFQTRYMETSPIKLLNQGNILYYPTTLGKYLEIPPLERVGIGFQFPSREGKISVNSGVLCFGILNTSPNSAVAQAFGAWLYKKGNLEAYLQKNILRHHYSTGLGGALSAIKDLNPQILPRINPGLMEKIPSPEALVFPKPLPNQWQDLRDQGIVPWLQSLHNEKSNLDLNAYLTKAIQIQSN